MFCRIIVYMTTYDAGNSAQHAHERATIETRIHMKQNEIAEDERRKVSLEGSITRIKIEMKHTADIMARLTTEAKTLTKEAEHERVVYRHAEEGGRVQGLEIEKHNDTIKKLEQDLEVLRKMIETKEHEINDVKESLRDLVKSREDFRKEFEAESFSARAANIHIHEKDVRLHQLMIENDGKAAEVTRKENEIAHLKQGLLRKKDEVAQFQAQIAQLK